MPERQEQAGASGKRGTAAGLAVFAASLLVAAAGIWTDGRGRPPAEEQISAPSASAILSSAGQDASAILSSQATEGRMSFAGHLTELSIYESGDVGDEEIYLWEREPGRELPERLLGSIHLKDVYMFVSFPVETEERLWLAQVRTDEPVRYEHEMTNASQPGTIRYKLRFFDVGDRLTVRLGDMPPIELTRTGEFMRVVSEIGAPMTADSPAPLLLYAQEKGARLYVEQGCKEVILAFNEPVAAGTVTGADGTAGQWIDERRLKLALPEGWEHGWRDYDYYPIAFDGLRTASGNRPRSMDYGLNLYEIERGEWRLAGDDSIWPTAAGLSGVYDRIFPSPDGKARLGFVGLGLPEGDSGGYLYGVVLERDGAQPEVVLDIFHAPDSLKQPPMVWLGNSSFVYTKWQQVIRYDMATGQRSVVFDLSGQQDVWILSIAHDAESQTFYVMTAKVAEDAPADAYLPEMTVDRHTFAVKDGVPLLPGQVQEKFARTGFKNKVELHRLPVKFRPEGAYWTTWRDGKVTTRFEGRNGQSAETVGEPIAAYAGGVYIGVTTEGTDVEGAGVQAMKWSPGQEPVALPAVPEEAEWVRYAPWGGRLTADLDGGERRYVYDDAAKGNWRLLELPQRRLPEREEAAVYWWAADPVRRVESGREYTLGSGLGVREEPSSVSGVAPMWEAQAGKSYNVVGQRGDYSLIREITDESMQGWVPSWYLTSAAAEIRKDGQQPLKLIGSDTATSVWPGGGSHGGFRLEAGRVVRVLKQYGEWRAVEFKLHDAQFFGDVWVPAAALADYDEKSAREGRVRPGAAIYNEEGAEKHRDWNDSAIIVGETKGSDGKLRLQISGPGGQDGWIEASDFLPNPFG